MDDTLALASAAIAALSAIYKPGYAYAKAGVMLIELIELERVPLDLFSDTEAKGESASLMAALDAMNARFGRGALTTGSAAASDIWRTRQDRRSLRT